MEQPSSVIRHAADNVDEIPKGEEEEAVQETPGRPDRSISEYAEAYVRMMEDREAGKQLAGSVITPQPDQEEDEKAPVNESNSSRPVSASSASIASVLPSNISSNPKLPISERREAPLAAPSSAQEPLGFKPSRSAVSGAAARPSSSNAPDSHSRQASQSSTSLHIRSSAPPRSHRRNPSNSGNVLPKIDSRSYEDDEEAAYVPSQRHRVNAGAMKAKNPIRQSLPHGASPLSSNGTISSRNGSKAWHARNGSTASSSSSNSDSPRANSSHLRLSSHDMLSMPPSQGLSSSGSMSSKHQKAKSTLFYIRRRIHAMRAVSLLMLIVMSTVTLISWIVLTKPLVRSQRLRTHGCTTVTTTFLDSAPVTSGWDTPTVDHRCIYFRHDMTPFLVVSGIWLAVSLGTSMINVAAGFMFYWRNFMRMAFLLNISIFFATIIVLNWTITLVAFGYEGENWRYRFDDSIVSSDESNRPGMIVKSASTSLLVGISIFWFFNFCSIIVLQQLRKYVMTKPRYCCWPLEALCCREQSPASYGFDGGVGSKAMMNNASNNLPSKSSSSQSSSGPFSIPSSILSSRSSSSNPGPPIKRLTNSDHSDSHELVEMVRIRPSRSSGRLPSPSSSSNLEDDPNHSNMDDSIISHDGSDTIEDSDGGVIIRESKPKSSAAPAPPRRPKRSSQQPDLTPLLSSLQGIQDTVNTLATKVQAIEQREVVAAPSYSDPFAYGRKPPQF